MGTLGTIWGGRHFAPPHTINICIFLFYPACTYSGERGGRVCTSHSIKARGVGTPQNVQRCHRDGHKGAGDQVWGCPVAGNGVSQDAGTKVAPGWEQGWHQGDTNISTKPWEWRWCLAGGWLGTSRGVPRGRGVLAGRDLCILCMKINLFSQYLYPGAAVWSPPFSVPTTDDPGVGDVPRAVAWWSWTPEQRVSPLSL